ACSATVIPRSIPAVRRAATSGGCGRPVQLGRVELERRLRLRVRIRVENESPALEVRARLGGDLERLVREGLRPELEDPRAVGDEPELGDELAAVVRRDEGLLEYEGRAEQVEAVQLDPLRRVGGEERTLLLREELAQRPRAGGGLAHLVVRRLALHRRRADV